MSTVKTSVAAIPSFSFGRLAVGALEGIETALRWLGGIVLAAMFVLVMTLTPLVFKKVPPAEVEVKLTVVVPEVLGLLNESCR